MRTLLVLLFCVMVFFTACEQSAPETGWTKWRGPNVNSVSSETNWDAEKLDSSNIVWTKDIGFGHSAISTLGDKCYTSGWKEIATETDTIAETTIFCIDIKTGEDVWTFTYPAAKRNYPGPRVTPVIDNDKLYTISWEGKLFCLELETGNEVWSLDLAADSLTAIEYWGYCPSPVIHNNLLLLNLNKSGIALDKTNGDVVWNSSFKNSSWASVYLINNEEKMRGVFQSDTIIYLVDVETGEVESSYKKVTDGAINDDVILLPDGMLYANDEMIKLSGTEMEQVWHNDSIPSFFRTGVIVGNYSYQFSDTKRKNNLYCVDLETGIPQWVQEMDGRWGNLLAVNDKLMILNSSGKVIIANATPEKYDIVKELQVLTNSNKPDYFCWIAPTFVDGKLFIRNSIGEMACINLGN